MKKFKFGSRILAFVLVFIMLVTAAPLSALAGTVGWITTGTYAGKVGFDTSTQNQDGTINWPIKIYDYLADGMLFDFPENSTKSIYAESYSNDGGGMYGGGEPMPVTKLGSDYTGDWIYSSYTTNTGSAYNPSNNYSKTKKAAVANSSPQYLRLSYASGSAGYANYCVCDFARDYSASQPASNIRYMTMVYRSSGVVKASSGTAQDSSAAFLFNTNMSSSGTWVRMRYNGFQNSSSWTYVVIDLKECYDAYNGSGSWDNIASNFYRIYIRPNMQNTSAYLDLSHIAFFNNSFEAEQYGKDALAFVKNPGTKLVTATSKYTAGKWNAGNNRGFGLLMPSTGGGWTTGGGASSLVNGYQSYRVGYSLYTADGVSGLATDAYNNTRKNLNGTLIGNNQIYFVTDAYKDSATYKSQLTSDSDPNNDSDYEKGFNTSVVDFDGYDLLTNVTSGLMTMGLLDNKLQNGLPVYRIEAIEYVAEMLYKTLPIPQRAASGNYNYNFVKGVADAQFGTDSSGKALDLPQALRNCLGITFTSGKDKGSTPTYGNYSDTVAKQNGLMGEFKNVKGNIKTCMDAAYYLLNNLFVEGSYNQKQTDFRYLTLSSGTMDDGRKAYIFDGGFTTGDASTVTDTQASQDAYKQTSQSSVQYSSFKDNGDGTISLGPVKSKDQYWYETNASTTQYPFLPVKNATGTYAGETQTYYFVEDGVRGHSQYGSTYVDRNYNYVMASNGEFVFHEEDNLFFQFEGDDDVYLFLNNELVLDIGGAHGISTVEFDVNDYVEWAKGVLANPSAYTEKDIARANALNFEDGEIVSFDFYYMERHGTGANCRIVTNMHITDPAIRTQKQAFQNGKEIDYGGIVDGEHRIEYAFTTNNGGNTKLYNLTYDDADIGVSLTPESGLFVKGEDTPSINDDINGIYVTDVRGEKLEASDLTARVVGYKDVGIGNGEYSLEGTEYVNVGKGNGRFEYADVTVTFADNQALMNFLKTLDSNVTDTELVDEEQTRRGSGLWVDASMTIRGIYYTMTSKQRDAGYFSNTVLVTATTKADTQNEGNEILRGNDNHRVYITAIPAYYQWKDHEVHILGTRVLDDAIKEAGKEGSQLHDYKSFFEKVTQSGKGINAIWTSFCDKNGKKIDSYDHVIDQNPVPGDNNYWGFTANYDTTGIHEFYLLMYLQDEVAGYDVTGDIETMQPGEYAIVRVLVIVSDVEDATYVLDYGLKTENLDSYGELFRGDELLGSMSGVESKLMGINTTGGEYLPISKGYQNYNRIDFDAMQLDEHNNIYVNGKDGKADGFYTFNMNIGENGKEITYNAFSDMYSLTDSGTTHVHAETPGAWGDMYLYYWYDDGRNNGWPGQQMNKTSAGNYSLDIPGNVPHIIISQKIDDQTSIQTVDLTINPGEEVWIDFGDDPQLQNGKYLPTIEYKSRDGIIHATVPDGWGDVYYYCWDAFSNALEEWPGTKLEAKDSEGYYTFTIPGDITNIIINNGEDGVEVTGEDGVTSLIRKQTTDLTISAGKETWITVNNTPIENTTNPEKYTAVATQSLEKVIMHATVPSFWSDAYLYYWNSNGSYTGVNWPGIQMTKDAETGVYSLEVPADVENIIINDGKFRQTENLTVTAGLETWVNVEVLTSNATVQATKPADWENVFFYFYKSGYVGDVADTWPGTKGYDLFDTGSYSVNVPPYATHVVINNGADKKTKDLALSADTINNFIIEETGETVVQATVPDWWFDICIHYWNEATGESTQWPGVPVTKGEDGTITFLPPEGTTHVILNAHHNPESDDRQKTEDLKLAQSAINKVSVKNHLDQSIETLVHATSNITRVVPPSTTTKAEVTYGVDAETEGFSFTPVDFMDYEYNLWMALTIHDKNINPTKLGQPIDIGNEVQMFKKVTVLPASVVYYEDTFAGINYADKSTTSNVINHYTSGTGSLTQSIDQNQQYGNDKVYQGSDNGEITGGSLTDVYINDQNEFASFTFTGTGLEVIGHNHAQEGGTLVVELYDNDGNFIKEVPVITEFDNGGDGGSESIVAVPIIRISGLEYGTYKVVLKGIPVFDFDNWTDFSKLPPVAQSYLCIDGIRIYQPISGSAQLTDRHNIALNKTYTGANVAEAPSLNGVYYTANLTDGVASDVIDTTNGRHHWFGYHKTLNHQTAEDGSPYGQFTVDLNDNYRLDQFKMHVGSKEFGTPSYVDVYVSSDNAKWTYAGSPSNIDYNAANAYWVDLKLDEAVEGRYVRFNFGFVDPYYWVFVNEVEIYGDKIVTGPGVHDAYIDNEKGAEFTEIRNLIKQRQAFVVKYTDDNGLSVSGGTNTWIENRNNVLPGDHNTKWTNNTVNSVNDYMIAGPNNEVYMIESTDAEQSALAFYVEEKDADAATMQIGIRALDYRSFVGSGTAGKYNAEIQYGAVGDDGSIVWRTLTTTTTPAEQYYEIPYTECPYDETLNRYQVVIRVADTSPNGMAAYTTLKLNGLELLTLNESEVPDVTYGEDIRNVLLDSNGNTLDSSKFVGFIDLVDQMHATSEPEQGGNTGTTTPTEPVITGSDTSSMGVLYDSFTANSSDFGITEKSKIFIVTDSEANKPADKIIETAQLAQRQFAADGYDMQVVWGLEKYATKGDIIIYTGSAYSTNGDEGYTLEVTDRAKLQCTDEDGLLYGMNTLQKHFRAAGKNAIKGFKIVDQPDTKERALHLDVARKYLTKEMVKNYIAELSWMGYNAIELHMSEDGGMRMDFWGNKALQEVPNMSGNDFSWICGSNPAPWVFTQFRDDNGKVNDKGKYLTTEEIIEICETAKEYNIEVIPSFDTPAHVGYMTELYYNTVKNNANSSIRNFTYNGTNYTLPTQINYRTYTGVNDDEYDFAVLDLSNTAVKNFAYAMYNDIAAFFKHYAGSTDFNIGADEVVLNTSTDRWTYTDFINYTNSVNSVLKSHGYRTRMYNDFVYKDYTSSVALDKDIDIVYWLPKASSRTSLKSASAIAKDGRTVYNGNLFWTYYVLRIAPVNIDKNTGVHTNAGTQDARNPNNRQWEFYRNREDYIYNEFTASQTGAYTDSNMGSANNYSGDKLGGAYFMIWNDFAGLNTEVEVWNGCFDEYSTNNQNTGVHSGNGMFYSLIERMWSGGIKQWNSDINSTLTFANFETLRDKQGFFPGYVATPSTEAYARGMNLPAAEEVEGQYRTYYEVTFKNYDGSVIETQMVKEGTAATAPQTPTRPATVWYTYTFTGWDTDFSDITSATTVTAQYSESATIAGKIGYVEIKNSGGSDLQVSVDGSGYRPVGMTYVNPSMDFGRLVSVKASTNNDHKFLGWVNAKTGEVVKTEPQLSFYSSGNDVFIAMYEADHTSGKSLVTFKNDKTNQIIDIQYYGADDILAFPAVADYPGYKFVGWDKSDVQIMDALAKGENITITTKWVTNNVYFTVKVNGGELTSFVSGGVNDQYQAYKATVVTADAPASGQKFAYWTDEQGRIVSFDAEYKFYPHKNTELTAVYTSSSATISNQVISTVDIDTETLGDANTVFFSWDSSTTDYQIINVGVLLTKKENYYSGTFGVGTIDKNVLQFVPPVSHRTFNANSYSITIPNVQVGDTWVAKSFVQYRDTEGVLRVAYSDLCEATKPLQ